MFVDTFIRRPILASVCSLVIILAGALRHSDAARRAVPRPRAATGASALRSTTARAPQTVESAVTTPIEQAINGVERNRDGGFDGLRVGAVVERGDLQRTAAPAPETARSAASGSR